LECGGLVHPEPRTAAAFSIVATLRRAVRPVGLNGFLAGLSYFWKKSEQQSHDRHPQWWVVPIGMAAFNTLSGSHPIPKALPPRDHLQRRIQQVVEQPLMAVRFCLTSVARVAAKTTQPDAFGFDSTIASENTGGRTPRSGTG
jgi:hypothetical protein